MALREQFSIGVLVRYGLGALALAWVLTSVDWTQIVDLLGEMPAWILGGILVTSVLGVVPRVWMWEALIDHFDGATFGNVLRADLVVKFVNSLFPSRFSGRSVAPLAIRHFTGATWEDATAVTGAHTGLYAVWYGLACLAGLVVLAPQLSVGVLLVVALSTAVYVVVGGLIVAGGWHLDRLEPVLGRLGSLLAYVPVVGDRLASLAASATPVIAKSASGFRTVMADHRALAGYGLSWILALVVFPSVRVWLLFVGFDATPPQPWLLPLVLITGYAVTVLPLTPGGVGVAEATSTIVFVSLGYPAAIVVPTVVLDRFLGVYLPALAGWYPTVTADLSTYVPDSD